MTTKRGGAARTPGPAAQFGEAANSPRALREYALLADGERGAVLGPRGDIVWMCAPSWDSNAVFTSLIGGPGEYTVTRVRRSTPVATATGWPCCMDGS